MNGLSLKKNILLLFFLVSILWAFEEAFPSPPNFDFNIQSHHLIIEIDPLRHLLKAEDRIEIHLQEEKGQTVSFFLHPQLKVTRIANSKTGQPFEWSETVFSTNARRLDVSLEKMERLFFLSIFYEGLIYDPVVKEKGLQFVRGDQTSGLISPEGVYLSSATHWYPDRPDSMARFKVEATIP